MHQVLMEGMKTVPKNTWLQVVPQLIARIDSPKDLVRNLIHSLLVDVGKQHPQVWREGRGGEGRGGEGRGGEGGEGEGRRGEGRGGEGRGGEEMQSLFPVVYRLVAH